MNKTLTLNHTTFISKFLCIVGLLLLASLLTIYLFQIVSLTEKEFLLKSRRGIISQLAESNKALEIEYSAANSLAKIETVSRALGFEKVGRIHYIRVLEGSVASK